MSARGNGPRRSIFERLRVALRGSPATLPIGEALHPVTVIALGLLIVNDWVLKPVVPITSPWHPAVGKLSDLAGLAAAPVVFTAALGLILQVGRLAGVRVSPWLTRRRLVASIVATAATFTAIKLVPAAASYFINVASWFGHRAHVALDPTDLLALPMLGIAYLVGRDELRRLELEGHVERESQSGSG